MGNSFSFSKIESYDNCRFRYKLKYVDKHYFSADSIATCYGKLVHKIEELIAKYIMSNIPIDYADLKNKFINGVEDDGKFIKGINDLATAFEQDYFKPDSKSGKTYEEKSQYYLEEGIYRLEKLMIANPTYRIIGVELPFEFENEIGAFNGVIDRAIYDSQTNKVIIQDIKTYSEPMEASKLKAPLQMVIYTMAAKRGFKLLNEEIICQYDLPLVNVIQTVTNKNYMNDGIKRLQKLFNEINDNNFEPKPSPLCHWCEFCATNKNAPEKGKYLCPYFNIWTREKPSRDVANTWLGLDNHEAVLNNYYKTINLDNSNTRGGE